MSVKRQPDKESAIASAQADVKAPIYREVEGPRVNTLGPGQTVCNERRERGKLCNGHLKQMNTRGQDSKKHLRGDDVLFQCQMCGASYSGPPLGHLRDETKQSRFLQKQLTAILKAAGGTLPRFNKAKEEPKG